MLLSYQFNELEKEHEGLLLEAKRIRKILESLDPLRSNLKIKVTIESDHRDPFGSSARRDLIFVVADKNSWIPMFQPIQRCLYGIYTRRLGEVERRLEEFRRKSIDHSLPDLIKEFKRTI